MSVPHKSPHITAMGSIQRLVLAAMLVAMSVVIGILCKNFLNFAAGLLRITFENLPILLAGIFLGPLVGGLVGLSSDLVSYFMSSQIYPPNILVTLGACLVGVLSGLMAKYVVKKRGVKQIVLSSAVAHLFGSMIVKSIGLFTFYSWGILIRVPLYLVIATVEICLMCLLWRHRSFRRLFEKL